MESGANSFINKYKSSLKYKSKMWCKIERYLGLGSVAADEDSQIHVITAHWD